MAAETVPYGRVTQKKPAVAEIHIVWITAGLGCDRDSVSVTAAMQPSIEDVLLGAIPGLPKVHLHNPVLAANRSESEQSLKKEPRSERNLSSRERLAGSARGRMAGLKSPPGKLPTATCLGTLDQCPESVAPKHQVWLRWHREVLLLLRQQAT
jgi:hypothetical protein